MEDIVNNIIDKVEEINLKEINYKVCLELDCEVFYRQGNRNNNYKKKETNFITPLIKNFKKTITEYNIRSSIVLQDEMMDNIKQFYLYTQDKISALDNGTPASFKFNFKIVVLQTAEDVLDTTKYKIITEYDIDTDKARCITKVFNQFLIHFKVIGLSIIQLLEFLNKN